MREGERKQRSGKSPRGAGKPRADLGGGRSARSRQADRPAAGGPIILYGWHPVKAALENPARRIRHLWTTENAAHRLADEQVTLPVAPDIVRPDAIASRLPADAVIPGATTLQRAG